MIESTTAGSAVGVCSATVESTTTSSAVVVFSVHDGSAVGGFVAYACSTLGRFWVGKEVENIIL